MSRKAPPMKVDTHHPLASSYKTVTLWFTALDQFKNSFYDRALPGPIIISLLL